MHATSQVCGHANQPATVPSFLLFGRCRPNPRFVLYSEGGTHSFHTVSAKKKTKRITHQMSASAEVCEN